MFHQKNGPVQFTVTYECNHVAASEQLLLSHKGEIQPKVQAEVLKNVKGIYTE